MEKTKVDSALTKGRKHPIRTFHHLINPPPKFPLHLWYYVPHDIYSSTHLVIAWGSRYTWIHDFEFLVALLKTDLSSSWLLDGLVRKCQHIQLQTMMMLGSPLYPIWYKNVQETLTKAESTSRQTYRQRTISSCFKSIERTCIHDWTFSYKYISRSQH